ncbi:hypothetical protein [Streptomyces cinnamoneus]|uniref:hypothetical protein n=1 Tax=Streptomyces cinnamoneus TaxID=53446 RepID=UPI00167E42F8|nr:hypothetical protein [Streptomyces cinnamoneus]
MLAVAGGAAVIVIVLVVVMLLGKGDNPGRSQTEAQQLAEEVSPRPADWGPGFSDTQSTASTDEYSVADDCKVSTKAARPGTTHSLSRAVSRKNPETNAYSTVTVYNTAKTAESFMKDLESGIQRCPKQEGDGYGWENVRQGSAAQLSGFDQAVVREAAYYEVDSNNQKIQTANALAAGRSGDVVLSTEVDAPPGQENQVRDIAVKTLQLMQKRLAEKEKALPAKH